RPVVVAVLVIVVFPAEGQESETDLLRKQLKNATERFDRLVREQRETMEQLSRRIESLEKGAPAAASSGTNDPLAAALVADAQNKSSREQGRNASASQGNSWSPASPIRVAGAGENYLTLSFDALCAAASTTACDIAR